MDKKQDIYAIAITGESGSGKTTLSLENVKVILVEGTYVSLLKHLDYRIFIDIHYKQTHYERIHRNRETVTDFIEKVLEKESEIIQLHRKNADALMFQNREIQFNKNLSL